jgi:hypothetical protein
LFLSSLPAQGLHENRHPSKTDHIAGAQESRSGLPSGQTIIDFHERLLARLGSSSNDPVPLPEHWLTSIIGLSAASELTRLLERLPKDTPLTLINDSRLYGETGDRPLWRAHATSVSTGQRRRMCFHSTRTLSWGPTASTGRWPLPDVPD